MSIMIGFLIQSFFILLMKCTLVFLTIVENECYTILFSHS